MANKPKSNRNPDKRKEQHTLKKNNNNNNKNKMKRERESTSGAKIHAKLFVRYKKIFFKELMFGRLGRKW